MLIKMDDMCVKGVATDCWQDGVRQFYRNKSISDKTKAMIWQKHEIYCLEAEGKGRHLG